MTTCARLARWPQAGVPMGTLKAIMEAKELLRRLKSFTEFMLLDEIRPFRLSYRQDPLLLAGMVLSEPRGNFGSY